MPCNRSEKPLLAFFKISRIFREISPRKIRDWKQIGAPLVDYLASKEVTFKQSKVPLIQVSKIKTKLQLFVI